MRSLISLFAFAAAVAASEAPRPNAWRNILETLNLTPELGAPVILPAETATADPAQLAARIEAGAWAIFEGASSSAQAFGIVPGDDRVLVRSIVDTRMPSLSIVWAEPAEAAVVRLPDGAQVYAREKRSNAPVLAGWKRGAGGILWTATSPGPEGHERYPFLLQSLDELGLKAPLQSRRLWVFFDSSYRLRADPEYLARRWRAQGVSALHVAAWHYYDADPTRDSYLQRLIGACHRNAILVYAWLELPHVSEGFWNAHPEWREKTALGTDAHLDWRKLMNLRDPACAAAIKHGVKQLLLRFDWDGVNLAELYFESLEGHQNPSRFTPMNLNVRAEFKAAAGFDPIELFDPASPRSWTRNSDALSKFLEFRAGVARQLQEEWLGEIAAIRAERPYLDVALTHVDNLLEPDTRARIGADAKGLLPLLAERKLTFLIEDPATAWSLGPRRYPEIASRYEPVTPRFDRLAIDINVVERYQDVYPTRQQAGVEMLREVHLAAGAFPRLTLYFESSLYRPDWPLVSLAMPAAQSLARNGDAVTVKLKRPAGLRWRGPAIVNGQHWPAQDGEWVWLPAGEHRVEPGTAPDGAMRLLDLNADLTYAARAPGGVEFSYSSTARALARLSTPPRQMWIDGVPAQPTLWIFDQEWVLVLPPGQHVVTVGGNSGV